MVGDWRAGASVTLPAGRVPVMRDAADLGLAPGGTRLDRMILLLEPSAAKSRALELELEAQQTRGSCAYHQWLSAGQFADRYANSAADVNAVADWLRGEGFSVAALPVSRGWIEFSGTAAQVSTAFGAAVHAYSSASGQRFVVRGGVSVPGAFAGLIRGLVSLDGASAAAAVTAPLLVRADPAALAAERDAARAEALTPALAARLMHFDGLGSRSEESIAIAARSNVQPGDIAAFRSTFGLAANPVVAAPVGLDPGLTGDQAAAEMAASWAGVAASGARIVVVPAGSTAATDGVDLSLAAIVDQALAHTVVVGYSSCEAALSEAHLAFYDALFRQAAAEGMAVISATGDSGAAACEAAGSDAPVTSGYAVNALAATRWNTAVGAAAFGSGDGSALAAWAPIHAAEPAYATGGGRSSVVAVPAWQAGLVGGSTARAVPDVSLPTGLDSAFSRGVAFCFSGTSAASGCNLVRSGGSAAAAAIFAGVAAVVAEKNGAQGNLAPRLYALRARDGVYTDIEAGSARLACAAGSSGCDAGGTLGYDAGAGYDLASGLGVPNGANLVKAWPDADAQTSTTTTVVPSTTTPAAGTAFAVSVTVASATAPAGTPSPTGQVTLTLDGAPYANVDVITASGSTSASFSVTIASGGQHDLQATYAGDANYTTSTSTPVTVTVKPVLPVTVTLAVTPTSAAPGQVVTLLATVAPATAPASSIEQNPTGNVVFYNGTTVLGTVALSPAANNSATAQLVLTTLPGGQDTLTAVYVGDLYFETATSNAVTITVQDFSITPGPGNPPADLDIVKGKSGQVSYVVTGLGGFNGQIALTCQVPLQDDMTCTANPALVTPTGTVTFTITTFASGTTSASARAPSGRALGGMALAVLVFFLLPAGRRARIFAERGRRILMLVLLLGAIGASGIGCSSVAGTALNAGGTPLGQTTLTIVGAANVDNAVFSHKVYLTVNVMPAASSTAQPGKGAK